ncbi:PREDICTED: keratin-associated protein 27-1 [Miniopterus natalensis]|uniref:keratin-associated protein 27-1 n=1 Tax=Miniopterus natalensis TaxID=291302 RepID=UPI0007A72DA6|nr:PREDICTED: keratin-associated protein 27-1 [Miniopterus natalensis]
MPLRPCPSPRSSHGAPTLSAFVHGSDPVNTGDGLFLPSTCHSRTWLLGNVEEACGGARCGQVPDHTQELCLEKGGVQSARLHRVALRTCTKARPREGTACPSGGSSAELQCVAQPCQSGASQQTGGAIQGCQPGSSVAKRCPPKTYVSKNCRTLGLESSQCHRQSPDSSPRRPPASVTPGPRLPEPPASAYEPTCCVTGGWQLPSDTCHSRTWLLGNVEEACGGARCGQVPDHTQELCLEKGGVQSARLHRVALRTCAKARPREGTACPSGGSSAELQCVAQPCQSGASQQTGGAIQGCQPGSSVAKRCPPKTYVSKNCRTLGLESSQCHRQSPDSSPRRPPASVTPGPRLPEPPASAYEPTCCVTGGWQLPSE